MSGARRLRAVGVSRRRAVQIYEGDWHPMESPEVTECCDCGLVHKTEFRIDGDTGRIMWRTVTDARATRKARKRAGITVTTVT